MSREGDLMRKALRKHLLPALQQLGFSGRTSSFQRCSDECLDLLDIQYWKYGGQFLLEFARCKRGPLLTSWGETVPEEKLNVAYVSPVARARLEQRGSAAGEGFRGFQFQGFGEDPEKYRQLAAQVVTLLPQVENWLCNRAAGSHIHAL